MEIQKFPKHVKEKSKRRLDLFNKMLAHFKREEQESHEEKIDKAKNQKPKTRLTQQASPQVDKCSHHFRYLNQRSKGKKIPEECLTCQKLIDCMRSVH